MNWQELKYLDEQYVMHTYDRYPVALSHGHGATVYDDEGRPYIDFTSGIGVTSLGHGNAALAEAILEQALKLSHSSNLYYNEPSLRLAEVLCQRSGMASVFFANSGTEANEAMIKLARKHSYDRYGEGRSTILTLKNSFHGRTMASLSATGQEALHQYFYPFLAGFESLEADIEAFRAAGSDVCAVMVELIQGEGGVIPLPKQFVHALAVLCAERDWLLLIDEVQTGIGRTGTLFAFQQYGILPDAISFAKGIAGGLPMGGILAGNRCRDVLGPRTHGSTFGGNPVCAAAALTVLDTVNESFLSEVVKKGDYLHSGLETLHLACLGEIRGAGLMIGVEVNEPWRSRVLSEQLTKGGLLCLTAGSALRFLPPLTITRPEIDRGLAIMKEVLE